ncbi:MAG: MFS transporter, partial [Parvimonas micra]|nr:MFS transporter [Parvimonas micra]
LSGFLILLGIALLFKFSIFSYFIIFMIFAFGVNFIANFINTPVMVWFTKAVPLEYQGRVFSILGTGCQLLMPLGILFYSFLFDKFKSGYIFIFSGIALMVLIVLPYMLKVDLKINKF